MTFSILLRIESANLVNKIASNSCQVSSAAELGILDCNFKFKIAHKFSIGFRSGLCTGQLSNNGIPDCLIHLCTTPAVCLGRYLVQIDIFRLEVVFALTTGIRFQGYFDTFLFSLFQLCNGEPQRHVRSYNPKS
jgi:hypothetical protein